MQITEIRYWGRAWNKHYNVVIKNFRKRGWNIWKDYLMTNLRISPVRTRG
jgi:hypothetical protein